MTGGRCVTRRVGITIPHELRNHEAEHGYFHSLPTVYR